MFNVEILDKNSFSRLPAIKIEKYDIQLGYIHGERSENIRQHAGLGSRFIFCKKRVIPQVASGAAHVQSKRPKQLPIDLPGHLLANPGPQQQEKYEFEEQDFEEILPMIRQK